MKTIMRAVECARGIAVAGTYRPMSIEWHAAQRCAEPALKLPSALRSLLWLTFLLTLAASSLLTPAGYAQTSYGSVVGTVTDQTGGTLIGAKVTLKNNDTGAVQTTATASGGNYTFVNLNPGSYNLTVAHSGFKASTSTAVDVQIGGVTRFDVGLQVGNVDQTVTVTGTEIGLQADSPTLGGVIEGQQVENAPLNGRNVNNLLDFVPGVVPGGGTSGSTTANGGSANFQAGGQTQAIAYGNYQIGGSFSGQSLFFIDGVGSNIVENNVNSLVLSQDAVHEFRVSTNDVSAEFGGYGGGVIQISSKSGTNNFHGSAYEYLRTTDLDANDWFSNNEGLGRQPLHQNQYGANLGGPGLKDKLFFFFSWEHESLLAQSPASFIVPTAAELAGNFAADNPIYCPAAGVNCGLAGIAPGQQFPNNQIPSDLIDPTAETILNLETPDESRVNQAAGASTGTNNFFASAPIEGFQNEFNTRVDANFGKDTLFARYTYWDPHNGISDPLGKKTGAGPTGNYTQEGVLGDTRVFNSTLIADVRLSYLENYNFQVPLSNGFDMSTISPTYGAIQSQNAGNQGQLPALTIQGYGIGEEFSQLYWNNDIWAINGSVTKISSKHTIKAGANWRQALWESYANQASLTLNALPSFTAASSTSTTTGNALASFVLGIPSSASTTYTETTHSFLHNYGFFVEDTFQASPKLTVNAGLRWEQPGAFSEEHDLDAILQPNKTVTIGGLTSFTNSLENAVPLIGQVALVNSPEYPSRREESLHWKLFSPRLGISYRVNPNTVVRSGYGISYFPPYLDQSGPQRGSLTSPSTNTTNVVGIAPSSTVANPLPNGVAQPAGHTQAAIDNLLGAGVWARIPNQAMGYSQQWNLAVQRALDSKSTVTVAYAGAKGTHLIISSAYTGSSYQRNQLPDQYDSLGAALLNPVANPFYGILPAGSAAGGATIPAGLLLLPYPQYPAGVLQQAPRYGSSTFHALEVAYIRHFGHAGILQGAYTWGKLLSDTDNSSAFQDGQGGTAITQDNYNLKAEKSLSEQDVANNLVIDYGVDLPIGRGQPLLPNINYAVNALVGGWRVDGITTLRSGVPIAVVANANELASVFNAGTPSFNLGPGIIRPDYTPGCPKGAPGSVHSRARAAQWFNTSCFSQPGQFAFGNESRVDPQLRTDGIDNFDTSINKSFDLPEQVKLKFSAEIFDLFNHPQFAEPNTTLGSAFGTVSHQLNLPRTIQLALRLSF